MHRLNSRGVFLLRMSCNQVLDVPKTTTSTTTLSFPRMLLDIVMPFCMD